MVYRALRSVTWRVTAAIRRQPLVGARHWKQEETRLFTVQPQQQHPIRRASNTRTTPSNQTGGSLKLLNHASPFWNNQHEITLFGRRIVKVSLSETAGHLSFLFLGLGYLETDVLPLRIYAAAGISCSIAFQYYRPEPLSIPISWNAIFLAINGFMVALLIKERYDARQQDQETSNLYDQVFRESGLTPVDFMKIIGISKTIKLAPGEVLARQDRLQEKLYLVLEGELQVSKNGQPIASVCAGDFAGEMSFLRYDRAEANSETEGCQSTAVADVIVAPSGAKVKSWDFDDLQEMLSDYPNMSVCFHATLASAMASKLVDSHDPSIRYRLLLQGILVDGVVTLTEKEALDKARKLMGVDNDTHARELKAAGWSAREFDQGYHDKLSCREYETLVKDVLRGGVVDDAGRTKLREYRMAKGIDALHHVRVLKTLGWTLNDLEAGRRLDRISVSAYSSRVGGADQPSTEAQGVAPRAGSLVDEERSPT